MTLHEDTSSWQDNLYDFLRASDVGIFAHVPDAGHKILINRSIADPDALSIVLTTEEEGVALLAGTDLGGRRGVLLIQSSGVGNCINMLSLGRAGGFPCLILVSMRGGLGEGNPWQYPMGEATQSVLEAMGVMCTPVHRKDDLMPAVSAAVTTVFTGGRSAAILLTQLLIGAKKF